MEIFRKDRHNKRFKFKTAMSQQITPEFIRQVQARATLLVSKETIDTTFTRLAHEVTEVLEHKNPIIITLMTGGLFTTSELCLKLKFPLQMDYIHATRYEGKLSGAALQWRKEPSLDLHERNILLIDDILDGGITLKRAQEYCLEKGAHKAYTLALLDKVAARLPEGLGKADFTGLEIPNEYVFGYGLDYYHYLRNVAGIYAVAKEHIL
jgi:hypoxanthine phosphoribosyltransferase